MFVRNLLIVASLASVAVTGFAKDNKPAKGGKPGDCAAFADAAACGKDKACKWTADAVDATKGSCAKADAKKK